MLEGTRGREGQLAVHVANKYPEPLRRAVGRANLAVGRACVLYSDRAALARARALAEVTPGLQRWRALIRLKTARV